MVHFQSHIFLDLLTLISAEVSPALNKISPFSSHCEYIYMSVVIPQVYRGEKKTHGDKIDTIFFLNSNNNVFLYNSYCYLIDYLGRKIEMTIYLKKNNENYVSHISCWGENKLQLREQEVMFVVFFSTQNSFKYLF